MTPEALRASLRARVDERKRLPKAPPWTMALRGTQHTLFVDDVTVAALAAGKVTARLQCQAALLTRYLVDTEEG